MNLQAADTVIIFDTDWNPQVKALGNLSFFITLFYILFYHISHVFYLGAFRLTFKHRLGPTGLDKRKKSLFCVLRQ